MEKPPCLTGEPIIKIVHRKVINLFACEPALPDNGSIHLQGSVLDTERFAPGTGSDIDFVFIWPGLDRRLYRTICRRLSSIEIGKRPARVEPRVGPCIPNGSKACGDGTITIQPQILPDVSWLSPVARMTLETAAVCVSGQPLPAFRPGDIEEKRLLNDLRRDLVRVRAMVCGRRTYYWRWSENGRFRRLFGSRQVEAGPPAAKLRRRAAGMLLHWAMLLNMRTSSAARNAHIDKFLKLASTVDDIGTFEDRWNTLSALYEESSK